MLTKRADELLTRLGEASAVLASRPDVDDATVAVVDEVRDAVAAMTPSEQDEVDPRLLDALQNGLLRAWQAIDADDSVTGRRAMRVAVEQIRQALVEIAEARPVAAGVPAKDVARWLDQALGVSREDLAGLLEVSPRTLGRWVAEGGTEPSGEDEMRLRLLARAAGHLRHALTGPGVVAWMRRPHPQLDGRPPAELLGRPEAAAALTLLAASTRSHVAT